MQQKMTLKITILFSLVLLLFNLSLSSAFAKSNVNLSSKNTVHHFVTRSGTRLLLQNQPFRFGGANIYWLGLDENVDGVNYPTYFRIKDALQTAADMGVTVVRSQTLGISTGNSLSIEPKLGKFNDSAFKTIDYAIYQAQILGIHLLIPLTDNYHYYHGGKHDFTDWLGLPESEFYTNQNSINAFEQYIKHVLSHVNPYTGRALKDDPTIMAWELGNELNNMPGSWIDTISSFIHKQAPRQLVAAGEQSGINPATLTSPYVDIVDVHYYPPTSSQVINDAKTVTDAGKVYINGEYPTTSATNDLLDPILKDNNISGAMFWSLFAHNDTYGYVQHDDGFTLHYPGDTPSMQDHAEAIRNFNYHMSGVDVPKEITPGQPLITSITKKYGENILAWRGTTNAAHYVVERSTTGPKGPWKTLARHGVTDNDTPWMDLNSPTSNAWYRVTAVNSDDQKGIASLPVRVGLNQGTLVDPLESWKYTTSHSDGLQIVPTNSGTAIVTHSNDVSNQQITWSQLSTVGVELLVKSQTPNIPLSLLISSDGTHWENVKPSITRESHNKYQISANQLNHVNFLKVKWTQIPGKSLEGHSVSILKATLHYNEPAIVDGLNDWSNTFSHTDNLVIDHSNPQYFGGDPSRVKRDTSTKENIVWHLDNMNAFNMLTYYWPDEDVSPFTLYTSADASNWTKVTPTIDEKTGNWSQYKYSLNNLSGVNYVKVEWNNLSGNAWTPQIANVNIYGDGDYSLSKPSAFQISVPENQATGVMTKPLFEWETASNAAYYSLIVSKNKDLSDPVINLTGIDSTNYTPDFELDPTSTYYWKVTAVNAAGDTSTDVASFKTADIPHSPLSVESFEEYNGDNTDLQNAYQRNVNGDPIIVALDGEHTDGSAYSMALNYTLGSSGYAGVSHSLSAPQSWLGYKGLQFWVNPDGSNCSLTIQFVANGTYWEDSLQLSGNTPQVVQLPFSDFKVPSWAPSGQMDLSSVSQLSIYVGGNSGSGTIYLDSLDAYPSN